MKHSTLCPCGDVNLTPECAQAWHYRRLLVDRLGVSMEEECVWLAGCTREHAKNYQLW